MSTRVPHRRPTAPATDHLATGHPATASVAASPFWRGVAARLRRVHAGQVVLWEHAGRDLEPWREVGALRWSNGRLDGVVLPDADSTPGG